MAIVLQDIAQRYHKMGANVTAIEAGHKGPAHQWERWTKVRQEPIDVRALPWQGYTVKKDSKRRKAGDQVTIGGVGVISGVNGWRIFDIDAIKGEDKKPVKLVSEETADALLNALGLPSSYPWTWRSGSGAGWEVAVRCEEKMPEGALTPDKRETGVFTGWPGDASSSDWHHLELRWESCQTVLPPSADGRGYAWRGEEPKEAPALVPLRRIIAAFYTLAVPPPHNLGTIERAVIDQIKQRFDLVKYASEHLGGELQNEGKEVRLLGHQGFLIDPERGLWYIHGEQIGGDCIDLVAFCKYQTTARNLNGKSAEILLEAATFTGVKIPERVPTVSVASPVAPSGVNPHTGEIVEQESDWRSKGTTAAALYHKEFQPLFWTVENILPEGAGLLAGKPKSRKSWGALDVAVSAARGERAFGRLATRQGRVLYLDLESNQRRMRGRLFSMVGHQMKDMENLHIFTDWERGQAGVEALEQWIQAFPDTVLIVIDVLADFRRPRDPKEDPYTYDRETVRPINALAEKYRLTILLVHHTRKAKADDVFDEISGSTGLPSAVATMWILGRAPNGSGEMVLTLRGRDLINDDPLALEWDDYQNRFAIVGTAADALQGTERRSVLTIMEDDQEWTPKDLGAQLRKSVNSVQLLMKSLLADGLVERTGYGKYVRVVPTQSTQSTQSRKNIQSTQSLDDQLCVTHPVTQSSTQSSTGLSNALKSPLDANSVHSVSLFKGNDDDDSTF